MYTEPMLWILTLRFERGKCFCNIILLNHHMYCICTMKFFLISGFSVCTISRIDRGPFKAGW